MLKLKITFKYRLTKTTYDATVTAPSTTIKDVREALTSQVDESLRNVDLVHVTIIGKVTEV